MNSGAVVVESTSCKSILGETMDVYLPHHIRRSTKILSFIAVEFCGIHCLPLSKTVMIWKVLNNVLGSFILHNLESILQCYVHI